MDKPKITISWDELKSQQVEDRLREKQTVVSTQKHYESANVVAAKRKAGLGDWLRISLVHLTLFGLLGGVIGWGTAELLNLRPAALAEARELIADHHAIARAESRGRYTADDAIAARARLARIGQDNAYFAVFLDTSLTEDQQQQRNDEITRRDRGQEFTADLLLFGVCGLCIAALLASADRLVDRNWNGAVVYAAIGAVVGLIGGATAAVLAWQLESRWLESLSAGPSWRDILPRAAAWTLLGIFIGAAPGIILKSPKRTLLGIAGGLLGGLVAGLLFDPIAKLSESNQISRLVGIVTIGGLVGLASGVLEQVVRVGWLRAVEGLIAGKQFILYRNPTYVGSAAMSHVFLFRDPTVGRRHAAIHQVPGGFEIENLPLGGDTLVNDEPVDRTKLRPGDRIRIGRTVFVFEHRTKKQSK